MLEWALSTRHFRRFDCRYWLICLQQKNVSNILELLFKRFKTHIVTEDMIKRWHKICGYEPCKSVFSYGNANRMVLKDRSIALGNTLSHSCVKFSFSMVQTSRLLLLRISASFTASSTHWRSPCPESPPPDGRPAIRRRAVPVLHTRRDIHHIPRM
jgi:hypothetical protein